MAAAPAYAATPVVWTGLVPASVDTSLTAPTNVTTLGTATSAGGSTGTKITQVDLIPAGSVVAGLVNIFLYDGTAYHLHESVTITAVTLSTTAGPTKITYTYDNLVLPASWSMRVTTTVAGNESLVTVNAYGASL